MKARVYYITYNRGRGYPETEWEWIQAMRAALSEGASNV